MADYCNITTDIQRLCSNIEDFDKVIVETFTSTSGNVWEKEGVGFVSAAFEDGTAYTAKTSIAAVEAAASSFWYDEATNKLYIQTSGQDTPNDTYRIEVGENWQTLKTACRDEAADDVDSYLSRRYKTPLMPRTILTHHSGAFDSVIIEATALITISKIIRRIDITLAQEYFNKAVNFDDELPKGVLNQLLDGDRTLRDQITNKEVGSHNIRSFNASNSTAIEPVITGIYTGSVYAIYRLQIDTAGAPGTSTWKLSDDSGASFSPTLQKTFDTNGASRRVLIIAGLYAYFPTTYADGDYWDIEVFPLSDSSEVTGAKIHTIRLTRK